MPGELAAKVSDRQMNPSILDAAVAGTQGLAIFAR
jgi:hypothetical protein